ncbi:MAG: type II toxin-antitoxin system Phd/YefM family antitoxin [Verrucomicrobia bacterium]|nr:type II toxin-antitoxin system Phd/YefM family antitoxin [Verrucomicrobiota bacterium]
MTSISITKARADLYNLVAEVNKNSRPVMLTNKNGKNGVLISEDDWNAIQETLYLNSDPRVRDSILEGGQTPLKDCLTENDVEW